MEPIITRTEYLKALDTVNQYQFQLTGKISILEKVVFEMENKANIYTGLKIENLALSKRPRSALKYCNITHIEQLTELSSKDLIKFRNMGARSIVEISHALKEFNLSLADGF